jgi:uncharacterized damage-inducible protein DinB
MRKADIDLLFSYNRWANAHILAACSGLSPTELCAAAPVSFGSLQGTLVHILGTENVWRLRLQQGISPRQLLQPGEFPDLASLTDRWGEEESAMQGFIALLKDEDMERKVHFTRMKGGEEEATVWKALIHVVLHGMQFRAEAGVVLSGIERSPGDLDFIFYLRDIGGR